MIGSGTPRVGAPTLPLGTIPNTPLSPLSTAGIAFLTAVPVFAGKLQAFDMVCLFAAPFVIGRVWRYGRIRVLSLALVIWAAGQLVADWLHGEGLFRLSMPLATALTILAIVALLVFLGRGDFRRIRLLLIGVAVGFILEQVFVQSTPLAASESWKYGLNVPVAVCLLAFTDYSWRSGRQMPSAVALALICIIGLVTDHRHLAGVAIVTAILLFVRRGRDHNPRTISVLAGVALLVTALSGAFLQAADTGALGVRSVRQVHQYGSSPVLIMVNVRPEAFQEFYLFTLSRYLAGDPNQSSTHRRILVRKISYGPSAWSARAANWTLTG